MEVRTLNVLPQRKGGIDKVIWGFKWVFKFI
uniref:Uncharacterized protein n=1 Tax=Anguilla anguilla TaxID=7936 RepID=A0A0E9UZP1_ANGAN